MAPTKASLLLLIAITVVVGVGGFSTPPPNSNARSSYRHDYNRDPTDVATDVDVEEINSLLAQRLDAKKTRRFRLADSIQDHLRTSFGVEIDDAKLRWTASPDANFGGGQRGRTNRQKQNNRFGPNGHDYQRTGGPMHPSCQLSEKEIHSLLAERLKCKLDRNYQKADNIQHMMWDAGVRIHDGRKQWRYDGGSFADEDGDGSSRNRQGRRDQRSKGSACMKSPYSEPISQEDEAYVTELIEKRMKAKRIKNYESADGIKEELLTMLNVHIDDRLKAWSVGGNFGDNRRYFDGEDYFFVGDVDRVDPKTLHIVQQAIAKRSEYKRRRNYDEADNIRDRLRETFGISVDDKRKSFWFENEFEANAKPKAKEERPKRQYARADDDDDDDDDDHKTIPWGDEIEDEYSEEGGTFVESSKDGSQKAPMLVPVIDSYTYAGTLTTSDVRAEDEAYITERLNRRIEAWKERDYDTSNAIETELSLAFNVVIDDELGQWTVGNVDERTLPVQPVPVPPVAADPHDEDSGARSTLESLTIPELKEKLREKGLKVSGKKGDLIARLLE